MATKTYVIDIMLEGGYSREGDQISELYGKFSYRPEGTSDWITLAQTNDSATWNLLDDQAAPSVNATTQKYVVKSRYIDIPTTSTFIEIQASLKEYDPSVFDADENLGTATMKFPLDSGQLATFQTSSSGERAGWRVNLISKEDDDARLQQMRQMRF